MQTAITRANADLEAAINTWVETDADWEAAANHIVRTAPVPLKWEWDAWGGITFSAR